MKLAYSSGSLIPSSSKTVSAKRPISVPPSIPAQVIVFSRQLAVTVGFVMLSENFDCNIDNLRNVTLCGLPMSASFPLRNGVNARIMNQADLSLGKGELQTCLDYSIVDSAGQITADKRPLIELICPGSKLEIHRAIAGSLGAFGDSIEGMRLLPYSVKMAFLCRGCVEIIQREHSRRL